MTSPDGTRLNVQEYGRTKGRTAVLAHGWTCSADFWTPQVRSLAREARLVVYEQRGHGGSAMPGPGGYTSDALADDLRAVLEACVPAGTRAVVVGHSMGAMAAIACAGRHPDVIRDRVCAAVLASTGVHGLTPSATVLGLPAALDPVFQPLARIALAVPMPLGRPSPANRRLIRYLTLSRSATPAQVRFCERLILACRTTVRARFGAALARFDLADDVRALTVPTAIVAGTTDRLTPLHHCRGIAAALPDLVELRELPEVGHMTPIEAPDVVNRMIRDALALVPAPASAGAPLPR